MEFFVVFVDQRPKFIGTGNQKFKVEVSHVPIKPPKTFRVSAHSTISLPYSADQVFVGWSA